MYLKLKSSRICVVVLSAVLFPCRCRKLTSVVSRRSPGTNLRSSSKKRKAQSTSKKLMKSCKGWRRRSSFAGSARWCYYVSRWKIQMSWCSRSRAVIGARCSSASRTPLRPRRFPGKLVSSMHFQQPPGTHPRLLSSPRAPKNLTQGPAHGLKRSSSRAKSSSKSASPSIWV